MTSEQKQRWYKATADLHDLRRDCLALLEQDREPDAMEMLTRLKRVEIALLKVALIKELR